MKGILRSFREQILLNLFWLDLSRAIIRGRFFFELKKGEVGWVDRT
jgi:hypothetical protein